MALVSLALLGTVPLHAAESNGQFLFGGDFPMQPSDKVRALFYESGMNCIRLTGGGYSWSVEGQKKLADDMQAHGAKVYLQLGSHYPSADYFKLQSAWFVDSEGKSGVEDRKAWSISYGDQHWPQYSYVSEDFRRMLEKDFATYLKPFSSNTNVAGVILHNEPGFFWMGDRIFDYGAPSVEAFRGWLQEQHGTIEKLNERWGTSYKSFAEVKPPGKPPVKEIGAWMDWRRFSAAQVGRFMAWEAGWFKTQRPDVPRSTNLAGPLDHWFGIRCADNYLCSQPMDKVGIDIYPTQWSDRTHVPYSMDMSQGVAQDRDVHVLECDVFSPKLWNYSETQRADMLRGELWTMIGHGAKAVLLWGFSRGDEFSLTDGEPNDRYYAARDIAHYANMIGVGNFSRPHPQVAVVVDPDSYIYATGTEATPNSVSPGEDGDAHGLYAALADNHIPADVIFATQLRNGEWKNYRGIVLAGARMMDEKTAGELEKFVNAGGTLIADAPLAAMDRWGKAYASAPGAGLDRLFGTITDASPAVTTRTVGSGKALMINQRAGQVYRDSSGHHLAKVMKDALAFAKPEPSVLQADAGLDTSIVKDAAGNLLLVASTLGGRGQAAPAISDGRLVLSVADADAYRSAFVLAPRQSSGTSVTSGPRKLEMRRSADGKSITLDTGAIMSATTIYITGEGHPLMTLKAPPKGTVGEEITVSVTIYNPSTRALTGQVDVQVNGTDASYRSNVDVAPEGQQIIPITVKAVAGRMVIGAVLHRERGEIPSLGGVRMDEKSPSTRAVPIDVNGV